MEILTAQARTTRLLLFAGAGISMPPPTSLPDWYTLNDTILQALARRLTAFTPEEFSKDVLAQLLATRNNTRYLSPDYQAQIMEDECGAGYFRVLQALDTGERNHCHNGIAALAAGGFLGAIVTTNFDRLIEHALTAAGVPHCVFHDYTGFEQLHAALAAPDGPLPVIKVHGSAEAPDSMVDTLRQRLMGRPESLEGAIGTLIARHHVVFAGFSGADLAYDQGYLGLQAAASNNQGFTCLLRPGEQPKTGMAALKNAWGANARFLEAMLPDWFDSLLGALDLSAPPKPAGVPAADRLSAVATHADQWSNSLGHMIAVAIMAELLESTGRSALAFDLLRRTYQTLSPERDMEAPGYARFNYQLGHRLLERGTFNNAIDWQHGRSSGPNVSPFTVNDCFQCLNRASGGNFPQGEIDMGLYEAYWGMPQTGAARIREVRKRAAALPHPIGFIDACRALAIVYEILMQYADALDWLERAHRIAQSAGDAPRRARLCAELGRFLAMKQRYNEGRAMIAEGQAVAEQLGLGVTSYELLSAEGSLLVEERRPEEALEKLDAAAAGFRELGYQPALLRCLIDVCYASYRLGRQDRLDAATQELFPLTAILPGYKPLAGLMLVRFHYWNGDAEGTREWIANTRKYCERIENPGMIEELEIIERKLDR